MATTLNVIKTITIRATAEGADQVAKQLQDIASKMDGVTIAAGSQEKALLSTESAYKRLQTRYDQEFRAQQQLAQVQKTLDAARNQGLVSQSRANELMQAAIKFHNSGAEAGAKHAAVLQELSSAATASASSLGTLGGVLSALGPVGVAVAVGIAAITAALALASKEALHFAEVAGKLRDTAETTGFTTDQIQALNRAAAQVGVATEKLEQGLNRFAAQMDDIQKHTGGAYQALLQLDKAAAQNIASAKSQGEAFELLGKALEDVDEVTRASTLRSIFGRGGVDLGRVFNFTSQQGGLTTFTEGLRKLDLITQEQANHWDDLGDSINENLRQIRQNIVSTFAGPTLEALKSVTDSLRSLSEIIQTTNWNSFLEFWRTWGILVPIVGLPLFAITNALKLIKEFQGTTPPLTTPSEAVPTPQIDPRNVEEQKRKINELKATVEEWRKGVVQAANDNQRLGTVMSGTQTPAEQLATKILLLKKGIAESGGSAEDAAEGIARLTREFNNDAAKRNRDALQGVATETEKLQGKINDLTAEVDRGNISWETANRAITGAIREEDIQTLERQVSALGDAATGAEKYAAGVARLKDQLEKGTITQDTFNRKVLELVPGFQNFSTNIGNFFSTFVQGMIDGKNATDALAASLKQLGQSITQAAFKDVGANISKSLSNAIGPSISSSLGLAGTAIGGLAGPLGAAAVGVGISLLGSLFDNSKEEAEAAARAQEEQAKWARLAQQYQDNVTKATAAALDLQKAGAPVAGEFASALEDINKSFSDFVAAETALGAEASSLTSMLTNATNQLRKNIEDSLQRGINEATGKGFLNQATDLVKEFADAFNTLTSTGGLTQSNIDLLNKFIFTGTQQIIDQNQLVGESYQELLKIVPQAVGGVHEYNAALVETAAAAQRSVDDLARASEALDDRLLAAVTDTSTLEGQLAILDRQQQREREEEVRQGGENLVQLEAVQAAERARVILDSNQQLLDDLQNSINAAAKNIVTYINQLLVGPDSALSPSARLQAAQSAFEAELALAQTGDIDAQSQITQFAEDFRKAGQDFFGSSAGYQAILDQITSSLLGLPAVSQSTDPVVNALADVVGAVDNNTALSVASTDGTTSAVIDVSALTEAANQIAASTQSVISSTNTLTASTNAFLDSSNQLLASSAQNLGQLVQLNQSINTSVALLSQVVQWTLGTFNNTAFIASWVPGSNHAQGGFIRGGRPYTDSVPLASGGLGMPGEFVIRRSVAQRYANALPTFNSTGQWPWNNDVTQEIRNLGSMLTALLQNIANLQEIANVKTDTNTQAIVTQTSEINRQARLESRKKHNKAA